MMYHIMRREQHSIRMDPAMWKALEEMARASGLSVGRLIELDIRASVEPSIQNSEILNEVYRRYHTRKTEKKK